MLAVEYGLATYNKIRRVGEIAMTVRLSFAFALRLTSLPLQAPSTGAFLSHNDSLAKEDLQNISDEEPASSDVQV